MTTILANIENNIIKMKRELQSINNKKNNTTIIYLPRYYILAAIVWLPKVSIFEADVKIIEV